MNAKYALALILALQVSMSLCEVPTPSQELLEKYNGMKTMLLKRLMNTYGKLHGAVAPIMEQISDTQQGQTVKTYAEEVQEKPKFQALVKVATGLAEEASPLVDKARLAALGMYEEYVRPQVGEHLSDAIDHIKVYLDMLMPVE